MELLKAVDCAGVTLQFNVFRERKQYQSLFGGVASIFMYLLSALYFGYIFYSWIQEDLPPKVQLQSKILKYEEFTLSQDMVGFQVSQNYNVDQNPFTEENNILTVLLLQTNGINYANPIPLFSKQNSQNPFVWNSTNLTNVKLILNPEGNASEILVLIIRCNQLFLSEGNFCASDQVIDSYLSSRSLFLALNINTQIWNEKTNQFDIYPKQYYFALDQQSPYYAQLFLKSTKLTLDQGYLFPNYRVRKYIHDSSIVGQGVSYQYLQNTFGLSSIFSVGIQLEIQQQNESITYPKLGEVLADIGSIVQLIFSVKSILVFYNNKQISKRFNETIVQSYQQKQNSIRSQSGDIVSAEDLKVIKNIAVKKLNIFNLYYEVAQMQQMIVKIQKELKRQIKSEKSQRDEEVNEPLILSENPKATNNSQKRQIHHMRILDNKEDEWQELMQMFLKPD